MFKLSSLSLAVLSALAFMPTVSVAADNTDATVLDEVTVTATRSSRGSKTVPAAITSVGKDKLDKLKMSSLSDALQNIPGVYTYSKNGLSESKLVIRGAGLKASYGIREIMVLRDGIPMTEPDSFTRLDLIDGQDIERLEVTKGPGSLYASGSAGGTVQVLTKSVFDQRGNNIKVGAGDDESKNIHARFGKKVGENQAVSISATHREVPNEWRYRNDQSSDHVSIKHGLQFGENNTLETELGYSKIDMQLAGNMNATQWEEFKSTGKQTGVDSSFKHTGRYSENFSLNTRAEIDKGSYTLKPKVYYSQYSHIHPVTGIINDNKKNPPSMFGADVEVEKKHQIGGKDAKAVFGVAGRINTTKDAEKYEYADVAKIAAGPQAGRITATLSDRKGKLSEVNSTKGKLLGIFGSENIKLNDKVSVDLSARVDDIQLTSDINQITKYDYATGKYIAGDGVSHNEHNMTLGSASAGISYALTDKINAFANIAKADQIPADSELDNNPSLKKASNRNIEVGLKGRSEKWSFDTSIYDTEGKDEVVRLVQNSQTTYMNAGKTSKKGFELSGSYAVTDKVSVGGGFAYNDYKYKKFQEPITVNGVTTVHDRAGKSLPTIPKTQANAFIEYKHPNGFATRVQARKDGSYYLDNSNDQKWMDNEIVGDLNMSYTKKKHKVDMTIENVFDKRYALEVSNDLSRNTKSYAAGAPRTVLVNYTYQF